MNDDIKRAFIAPGSHTSEAAADRIEGERATKLERLVFEVIKQAGPQGLADFEIDQAIAEHLAAGATARPRRCRLRDADLIRNTGASVINPETNRRQTRWALSCFVATAAPKRSESIRTTTEHEPDRRLGRDYSSTVGSILNALEDELSTCRSYWERSDLTESERVDKVAEVLGSALSEVSKHSAMLAEREQAHRDRGQARFHYAEDLWGYPV
jgi:hypothetical protein